jgi:hypothetical protein
MSMDGYGEIKATPIKREWAMTVANALRKGREIGNKVEIPVLGGLGDTFIGQAPEGFERVAYDEPLTTGAGWTTKLRPEAIDMGFLAADVAPIARSAVRGASKVATKGSDRLVQAIMKNKDVTGMDAIKAAGELSPVKQIFAGQKSAGANLEKLKQAQAMIPEGEDIASDLSRQVYKDTGWFRGADGQWRYEINDKPAYTANELEKGKFKKAQQAWFGVKGEANQFADGLRQNVKAGIIDTDTAQGLWKDRFDEIRPLQQKYEEVGNELGQMYKIGNTQRTTDLTRFLRHPELEDAYRGLKSKGSLDFVTANPHVRTGTSMDGYYQPDNMHIKMSAGNVKDVKSGLMHELQHHVQGVEGFAPGGSVQEFVDHQIMSNGGRADLHKAFNDYQRLSGEAEARAVQKRMGYSPKQRRDVFPLDDYDVPLDELIIKERKK